MSVRTDLLAARIYTLLVNSYHATDGLDYHLSSDLLRLAWEAAAAFHNESQLRDPITGQLKHAGLPADVADAIEAEVVE